MAMLAEPRRKQRIGPNPRGKFFIEDDENRGRQMLLKMGWKTGDGLGSSSQGMSEPIKPKVNTEARGLGFDIKQDPWVAHNEEFEQLLKNLNSSNGTNDVTKRSEGSSADEDAADSSGKGLETKSKTSRSRIHYHKFIKNKDLSRASMKDMSCIFGKSVDQLGAALNYTTNDSHQAEDVDALNVEKAGESVSNDCNVEVAKKKKKKNKRSRKDDDEEHTENNLEQSEAVALVDPDPVPDDIGVTLEDEEVQVKEKAKWKTKKRSKNLESVPGTTETSESVEPVLVDADDVDSSIKDEEIHKEKKRRKKRRDETNGNVDIDVNQEDSQTPVTIEDKFDEPTSKPKKKKKRKHSNVGPQEDADNFAVEHIALEIPETSEPLLDEERKSKKKKSKKRKRDLDEENPPSDPQPAVLADNDAVAPEVDAQVDESCTKKKRKKSKKHDVNDSANEIPSTDPTDEPKKSEDKSEPETFGSMQFINRGSIEDYFRQKRLEMLNRKMLKNT